MSDGRRRDERYICILSGSSPLTDLLTKQIRIRPHLQPCGESPPKLSFRAVRNRACAARACPERSEGTREESAFGPPVHDELTFLRKRFVSGHGFSRAAK